MSTSLGEVFVEIMGDASPLESDLTSAMSDLGDTISDELTGAFDGVTDGLGDDFVAAGEEAGSGLVDAIESEVDTLDVDASGAFDSIVDDAQSAAEEVGEAFDGVGEEIERSLGDVLGDVTERFGTMETAIGTLAGGAGMEAFSRQQLGMTEQTRRLAEGLGLTGSEVRDLALASSDVTRPLEQVLETMEIGRQQGIRNEEQLMEFVAAWDLVGDATGLAADELASLSPSLAAVGIDATEVEDAFAAFGFMTENTTMDVGEFMAIINRMGPDLRGMNLDIDDTAAVLGAMQGELGLTGRVARTEFSRAVNDADGDMGALLESLGLSEEQFAAYRAEVDESGHILQRNADLHADSYTVMQRGQAVLSDLMFRFGGLADAASIIAAPLGALGPAMLGMNQASQLLSSGLGTRLVGGLRAVTGAFRTLAVTILANPIFLIVAAVVAIIAIIWHFREEIMAALGAAWDWIRDSLGNLWEWLTGLWDSLVDIVSGAWDAVVAWLRGLPRRLIDALRGLATTVMDFIRRWHPLAILWRAMTGGGDEGEGGILAWLRGLPGRILESIREFATTVVEFVREYHPVAILWRQVQEWWPTVSGWFSGLPGRIADWFRDMRDQAIAILVAMAVRAIQWARDLHDRILGWIRDLVQSAVDRITSFRDDAIRAFTILRDTAIALVRRLAQRVVRLLVDLVRDAMRRVTDLRDRAIEAFTRLRDRVIEAIRRLRDRLVEFFTRIRDFLTTAARQARDRVISAITRMRDRVLERGRAILDWFRDLPGAIMDFLSDLPGRMREFGSDLIGSLLGGVTSMFGSIGDTVSDLGDAIVGGLGSFFSFGSPSKVMMQRGRWLSEGLADGIAEGIPDVMDALEKVANGAVVGTAPIVEANLFAADRAPAVRPSEVLAGGRRAGGVQVVQNIYTTHPERAAAEAVRRMRGRTRLDLPAGVR